MHFSAMDFNTDIVKVARYLIHHSDCKCDALGTQLSICTSSRLLPYLFIMDDESSTFPPCMMINHRVLNDNNSVWIIILLEISTGKVTL